MKIMCPKCGKDADFSDFEDDERHSDDMGICEIYTCSKCGEIYYAHLRYVAINKEWNWKD